MFPERLRALRLGAGLSLSELAQALNQTQQNDLTDRKMGARYDHTILSRSFAVSTIFSGITRLFKWAFF